MAFRFTQDFDIRNTQPIDVRQVVLDRTATVSNYQSAENFVGGDLSNPANGLETNTTFVGMVVYQTGAANGGSGLYVLTATPHTNESNWHHLSEARSQDSNVIIYTGTAITNAVPAGDIIVDNRTSNPVTYVSLMSVTLTADFDFAAAVTAGNLVQIADRDNDTIFNGGTVANATTFESNVSIQGNTDIGDGSDDTLTIQGNIAIPNTTTPAVNNQFLTRDAQGFVGLATPDGTNLASEAAADSVVVSSSTGDNATIAGATTTLAGVLSATDKQKIDNIGGSGTVSHLEGDYPFPIMVLDPPASQTFTLNYHLSQDVTLVNVTWAGELLLASPSLGITAGDHTSTITVEDIDISVIVANAPNSRPVLVYVLNGVTHRETIPLSQIDNNTTYDLGTVSSGTNGQIQLVPSTGDTDTVTVIGGQGVDVSSDADGNVTIASHAMGGSDAQISISGVDGINTTDNIIVQEATYQYASVTAGDGTTSVTFSASGVEVPTNAFQENVEVAVIPTTSTPATQTFTQDDITESEEILSAAIPALTSGTNPFRTTITLAHNLLNGDFNQVAQIGSRNAAVTQVQAVDYDTSTRALTIDILFDLDILGPSGAPGGVDIELTYFVIAPHNSVNITLGVTAFDQNDATATLTRNSQDFPATVAFVDLNTVLVTLAEAQGNFLGGDVITLTYNSAVEGIPTNGIITSASGQMVVVSFDSAFTAGAGTVYSLRSSQRIIPGAGSFNLNQVNDESIELRVNYNAAGFNNLPAISELRAEIAAINTGTTPHIYNASTFGFVPYPNGNLNNQSGGTIAGSNLQFTAPPTTNHAFGELSFAEELMPGVTRTGADILGATTMFVGSSSVGQRISRNIIYNPMHRAAYRNAGAFQNIAGGSTLTRGSNRIEDGGPSQGIYLAIEYMMTYGTQFDLHNAIPNNNPIPAPGVALSSVAGFGEYTGWTYGVTSEQLGNTAQRTNEADGDSLVGYHEVIVCFGRNNGNTTTSPDMATEGCLALRRRYRYRTSEIAGDNPLNRQLQGPAEYGRYIDSAAADWYEVIGGTIPQDMVMNEVSEMWLQIFVLTPSDSSNQLALNTQFGRRSQTNFANQNVVWTGVPFKYFQPPNLANDYAGEADADNAARPQIQDARLYANYSTITRQDLLDIKSRWDALSPFGTDPGQDPTAQIALAYQRAAGGGITTTATSKVNDAQVSNVQAVELPFGGILDYLTIDINTTAGDDEIAESGNPLHRAGNFQVTELHNTGAGFQDDLHTLASNRDTNKYPLPIDNTWFPGDLNAASADTVDVSLATGDTALPIVVTDAIGQGETMRIDSNVTVTPSSNRIDLGADAVEGTIVVHDGATGQGTTITGNQIGTTGLAGTGVRLVGANANGELVITTGTGTYNLGDHDIQELRNVQVNTSGTGDNQLAADDILKWDPDARGTGMGAWVNRNLGDVTGLGSHDLDALRDVDAYDNDTVATGSVLRFTDSNTWGVGTAADVSFNGESRYLSLGDTPANQQLTVSSIDLANADADTGHVVGLLSTSNINPTELNAAIDARATAIGDVITYMTSGATLAMFIADWDSSTSTNILVDGNTPTVADSVHTGDIIIIIDTASSPAARDTYLYIGTDIPFGGTVDPDNAHLIAEADALTAAQVLIRLNENDAAGDLIDTNLIGASRFDLDALRDVVYDVNNDPPVAGQILQRVTQGSGTEWQNVSLQVNPVENNNVPITSGGVFNALALKQDNLTTEQLQTLIDLDTSGLPDAPSEISEYVLQVATDGAVSWILNTDMHTDNAAIEVDAGGTITIDARVPGDAAAQQMALRDAISAVARLATAPTAGGGLNGTALDTNMVISQITVNDQGQTTAATARALSPASIGAVPADAATSEISIDTTGLQQLDTLTVNADGLVTTATTRTPIQADYLDDTEWINAVDSRNATIGDVFTFMAAGATIDTFRAQWEAGTTTNISPTPTATSELHAGDVVIVVDTTTSVRRTYLFTGDGIVFNNEVPANRLHLLSEGGDGITEDEADLRYLRLAGGTLTGDVAFASTQTFPNTANGTIGNIPAFDSSVDGLRPTTIREEYRTSGAARIPAGDRNTAVPEAGQITFSAANNLAGTGPFIIVITGSTQTDFPNGSYLVDRVVSGSTDTIVRLGNIRPLTNGVAGNAISPTTGGTKNIALFSSIFRAYQNDSALAYESGVEALIAGKLDVNLDNVGTVSNADATTFRTAISAASENDLENVRGRVTDIEGDLSPITTPHSATFTFGSQNLYGDTSPTDFFSNIDTTYFQSSNRFVLQTFNQDQGGRGVEALPSGWQLAVGTRVYVFADGDTPATDGSDNSRARFDVISTTPATGAGLPAGSVGVVTLRPVDQASIAYLESFGNDTGFEIAYNAQDNGDRLVDFRTATVAGATADAVISNSDGSLGRRAIGGSEADNIATVGQIVGTDFTADITFEGNNTFTGTNAFNNNVSFQDNITVGGLTFEANEQLALRLDQTGTITNSDLTGVDFDVTPSRATQVTYRTVQYYITYTVVGSAWTQRFYRVDGHTDATAPFWTINITT